MPELIDRMSEEEMTQYEDQGNPSLDRMDPREAPIERISGDPFNGSIEGKKEVPLRDWEKDLAEWSPNVYAGMRAMVLDMIPFANYVVLPSARDEFLKLDQEEQTQALLWESLGAALWGRFPRLGTDAKYLFGVGVKKPLRALGKLLGAEVKQAKVVPYEDAVKGLESLVGKDKIKPFVWAEEAQKRLVNRGFGKDEAEAVTASMASGSDDPLLNLIVERRFRGKTTTKEFQKATSWRTGGTYPKRQLKKELVEEFGEDVLRAKFYGKQFEKLLVRDVLKVKPTERTTDFIFKAHLDRLYPKKIGAGFGDVTPAQMSNILLDMMEHKALSWQIQHPTILATFKPARVVFGYGEKVMGTLSGIYAPLKASLGRMNKSYFNNSLLFSKMLEQRGVGKVKIKESGEFLFKRTKWAKPAVFDEAYKVMRKLDELSQTVSRTKGKEAVEGLRTEMGRVAKAVSPGAKVIIETARVY